MLFAATKRSVYTQNRIQKMRTERKGKKAKVSGVPDDKYIRSIGDLIGAGHLRFNGISTINLGNVVDIDVPTGVTEKRIRKTIELSKLNREDSGLGETPDIVGYLASGHPNDPQFKLKGWINEDGSIRIELVK